MRNLSRIAGVLCLAAHAATAAAVHVIRTESGEVSGITEHGVTTFGVCPTLIIYASGEGPFAN